MECTGQTHLVTFEFMDEWWRNAAGWRMRLCWTKAYGCTESRMTISTVQVLRGASIALWREWLQCTSVLREQLWILHSSLEVILSTGQVRIASTLRLASFFLKHWAQRPIEFGPNLDHVHSNFTPLGINPKQCTRETGSNPARGCADSPFEWALAAGIGHGCQCFCWLCGGAPWNHRSWAQRHPHPFDSIVMGRLKFCRYFSVRVWADFRFFRNNRFSDFHENLVVLEPRSVWWKYGSQSLVNYVFLGFRVYDSLMSCLGFKSMSAGFKV